MKILVVFTGGTIGCTVTNGVADVDSESSKLLINICSSYNDIDFEYQSPFGILSENANCDTLSHICNFMLNADFTNYDGIIITHGSDTLVYTSAMLGELLSFAEIPIVITAANYVLTSPRSNGTDNFKASIDFIKGFKKGVHTNRGVFTIWKNCDENVKVYISTRLNEADGYLDSFSSWGGSEYGMMKGGRFIRTESCVNPDNTVSSSHTLFLKGRTISLRNSVILLHSHVGLDFNAVNISGKSAVLLKLYHSGTACCGERNFSSKECNNVENSFLRFAERCYEEGVKVYVCPAKVGDYQYRTAKEIGAARIISLYSISTTAAYCKLMLAYAVDNEYRDNIISNNLFYEEL